MKQEEDKPRTLRQNRALHKMFELLAQNLNEAGYDQRRVLKETVEIPWSKESVKQQIWKPVQNIQLGKNSTTALTTREIDAVFDTINKHMGEKFGLHTAFPSIDDVILKQEAEKGATGANRNKSVS